MHILLPSILALAALANGAHHGSRNVHPRRLGGNDLIAKDQVFLSPLDTGNYTGSSLVKRSSYNGKGSYYAAGLGACGVTNSDSDYIVAINFQQYGDTSAVSPWCFQEITITYGGKSAQATIMDACQACGYGGLDLTPTLFEHFASESVGIIYLEWTSGGGDSSSTKASSTYEAPSSSWTPSTTAWTPSSSAWTPTTTSPAWSSSSVWSSADPSSSVVGSSAVSSSALGSSSLLSSGVLNSTSAALASASLSSSASSATTTVVASPSESVGGNLDILQQLVIQMGGLVAATAQNA